MGNLHRNRLTQPERDSYSLPSRLGIFDWVESRRFLSVRSEESGAMRLDRTPYVRPWLLAAVDPEIEEVVVCASAQVAKTEFGLSVAGYYTDVERASVLYSLADEHTARYISRDRVRKMYEDSPELLPLIERAPVVNNDEIELTNGAYISVVWASSVAALATRAFRVTIADEIDKPGYYVKSSEAMPLSLIRERTESFHNFKRIFFSTPTLEMGNITSELETCDVIYDWHVPCPHCKVFQPLRFSPEHAYGFDDKVYSGADGERHPLGRVVWDGSREATSVQVAGARYQCGSCGKKWTTAMKNRAVTRGISVPRQPLPAFVRKVGFHVNRLYSLLGKSGHLDKVVASFLGAVRSKNPRMIQGVINSTFAEPFRPHQKVRRTEVLARLKEDRPRGLVPSGGAVSCLLAGVDTQDYDFVYEIRAFGYGMTMDSWCIREGRVGTWEALKQVLWGDVYKDVEGRIYPVRLTLQDAMGHRTSEVYRFCLRNRGKIMPTQGMQTMATPYTTRAITRYPGTNKPLPGGLQLVRFDTNYYKSKLSGVLEIGVADPGAWRYHAEVTEDWLKQMTVESIGEKGLWENPLGRENHAWDCAALLLCAHEILGVQFWADPREEKPEKEASAPVESSGWIARRGSDSGGGGSWMKR